jgi:hypothetical protein
MLPRSHRTRNVFLLVNEDKCRQIRLKFICFLFFWLLVGYLMTSNIIDKNLTSKVSFDEDKISTSQSTDELSSNSIVNEEYLMEPNVNKTFFRTLNNSIIVSQVGSNVHIPCRVHLIGDEMVKFSSPHLT